MEDAHGEIGWQLSDRSVGIRSYVVRSGRMTDMQKVALEELYPKYGVPWTPGTAITGELLFGRPMPLIVEIGFGMGIATAAIAEALPDSGFLGLEVHAPGVGKLLSEIERLGLRNLRVMRHDAVDLVSQMLVPGSVDGFHVFFPDPWPKKRHHKRRLLGAEFVASLADRLKPGGYLYFVTDWEEYAEEVLSTMSAEPLLSNRYSSWAERQPWRPVTKFESRAIKDGRPIRELMFERR